MRTAVVKGMDKVAEIKAELEKENKISAQAREYASKESDRAEEEKAARVKVMEELKDMKSIPQESVQCQTPDELGVDAVPVKEYLEFYLCERFGLQGPMSEWEVERIGKDFGWVMEAQVHSRTTLG